MNSLLKSYLLRKGYLRWSVDGLAKDFKYDLKSKDTKFREKIWAWRRGYFSKRIQEYGLTENNYKDYLPDAIYYKLKPNGEYNGWRSWYDSKLTFRYILEPFKEHLPEYYYQLQNNRVLMLMDCPRSFGGSMKDVTNLLVLKKTLAAKPINGSRGSGFYKIVYKENGLYINQNPVTQDDLLSFLRNLNNYVITEYIDSHRELSKHYDGGLNTIRIMVVNDIDDGPQITGAYIRFSTSETGAVDNVSAGGVMCGVDVKTGEYFNPTRLINHRIEAVDCHPDSNEAIAGSVPRWHDVVSKLKEVARYTPQIQHYGMDVAITPKSFKIVEANMHHQINYIQVYYPVMRNEFNRKMFLRFMSEDQKKYYNGK